jgi:RHS repeat-associated protein
MGRLLSANVDGKAIAYKHNALGNRVSKLVDGVVVEKYLWLNKTTLVAIYDGNDNLVQRFEYTLGNTPISFTQNGSKFYISSDHLGSPRTISDASGNVLKAVDYDSFGNVVSDTNPTLEIPFGFAGGLHDKDTNLIRFGYRDFDPETGRWTARDPIGFAGGDTNLYGYVASDPVNFIDSNGLWAHVAIGAAIGGVANAISAYATNGNVAQAFVIGAASGAVAAATGGAAGGAILWGAREAGVEAVTAAATAAAEGKSYDEVAKAAVIALAVGRIGGVAGQAVAVKNALQLLKKGVNNKDFSRSDLAGALTSAMANLGITLTIEQREEIMESLLKSRCN